ncbi:MAG: hypothetical protein IPN29_11935 [Saprospiraceae bacterium]|nr:hypothetical protein [Saprospiraceae bacterium]
MRILFTIILWAKFLSISVTLHGQSDSSEYENFWANGKEVGVNVTPLLGKFVPFNLTTQSLQDQVIAVKTKWYGEKRAFILNFGIDISSATDNNQIFLSLGYERRRNISDRWKYTTGWEGILTTLSGNAGDDPILGISKPYGIEYHFTDNFYLSTEARFILGFLDGPTLQISYPNSIYFNMLLE